MKNNATLLIDACLGKYSYFSLKLIKLICNGFIIVILNELINIFQFLSCNF